MSRRIRNEVLTQPPETLKVCSCSNDAEIKTDCPWRSSRKSWRTTSRMRRRSSSSSKFLSQVPSFSSILYTTPSATLLTVIRSKSIYFIGLLLANSSPNEVLSRTARSPAIRGVFGVRGDDFGGSFWRIVFLSFPFHVLYIYQYVLQGQG